jgi:hypothetical protein
MRLLLAALLAVPAFAEEYEEAPDADERPTYDAVAADLKDRFKDDAKAFEAVRDNLEALSLTSGFEDLHGYQVLQTDEGRVLLNLELADGRAVFYDAKSGELVEMDPRRPGKLTPLRVKDGGVERVPERETAAAEFMKPFDGKTRGIRVGGNTGRYFFDGQESLYGDASTGFGRGRPAPQGEYYEAPKRMVVANDPGAEKAPEKLESGQTHYWVGKQLYYRAKEGNSSADVKVGYLTKGTDGKVIFYHGGAYPPDTGTGNHTRQKDFWTLYSVGDGKATVKLGRYHEVIRTWPKEKISGEGQSARLDISSHHRTVTNVPLSKEKGDDRAILRKIKGRYYRDTKVKSVDLYDYGPPAKVGKTELRRFVDRGTGDLYAEHLVHGNVRLVRTGRQAIKYPPRPEPQASPSDLTPDQYLVLPPAPQVDPEEQKRLSRPQTGLEETAPEDVGAVFSRLFPGAPASGAPKKGYSWFQDARKVLGKTGVEPVSRGEFDLLVKTFRDSDNDAHRAKAAIALGTVARMSGSEAYRDEAREALIAILVDGRGKPLVRNTVSGIPSYQEAAAHSLLRMGEIRTLLGWTRTSAYEDAHGILSDPPAFWGAYVLAGYTRDLAYSREHTRKFLALPVTGAGDDPSRLLRENMGYFASLLNTADGGFKVQDDLKWRVREKYTALRGVERRFETNSNDR